MSFDKELLQGASVETRIRKGYDFLDHRLPRWDVDVDPTELDQGDPFRCMLALAYRRTGMDYAQVVAMLERENPMLYTARWFEERGFYYGPSEAPTLPLDQERYASLTLVARDFIKQCRASRYGIQEQLELPLLH